MQPRQIRETFRPVVPSVDVVHDANLLTPTPRDRERCDAPSPSIGYGVGGVGVTGLTIARRGRTSTGGPWLRYRCRKSEPVRSHQSSRPELLSATVIRPARSFLEEALRVLEPRVLGVDVELVRFDLSLGSRVKQPITASSTKPPPRCARPASASRRRPSPRPRSAAWAHPTDPARGHRRQGHRSHRASHPRGDARSWRSSIPSSWFAWPSGMPTARHEGRDGEPGSPRESAWRTERIERSRVSVGRRVLISLGRARSAVSSTADRSGPCRRSTKAC